MSLGTLETPPLSSGTFVLLHRFKELGGGGEVGEEEEEDYLGSGKKEDDEETEA